MAKSVFPLGLVYYTDGETTLGRCRPNSFLASAPLQSLLQVLHADLAAADARQELARFERLWCRITVERLKYGGQPEAVLVSKVVTCAFGPVTLDEWCCAEVLQAGARRWQGLTPAFISCGCMLWRQRWEGRKSPKPASNWFTNKYCVCSQSLPSPTPLWLTAPKNQKHISVHVFHWTREPQLTLNNLTSCCQK